VTCLDV